MEKPSNRITDSLKQTRDNILQGVIDLPKWCTLPLRRKEAEERSNIFAAELMDFFSHNPSELLSPLQPSTGQMTSVHRLISTYQAGELGIYPGKGHIFSPDVDTKYVARAGNYSASLVLEWSAIEQYPGPFSIDGADNLQFSPDGRIMGDFDYHDRLIFMASSFQPKAIDDQRLNEGQTKSQIHVAENSDRIHVVKKLSDGGTESVQLRFIGAFTSGQYDENYWIYGYNSANRPQMVKSEINESVRGVRRLDPQIYPI